MNTEGRLFKTLPTENHTGTDIYRDMENIHEVFFPNMEHKCCTRLRMSVRVCPKMVHEKIFTL